MLISEVMTPCPYSVDSKTAIEDVIEKMGLYDVRHLPVVDDGNLVGVLSEGEARISQSLSASENVKLAAGDVCSSEPFVALESTRLSQVAKEMAEHKHDAALVVDAHGTFVGIFTVTDLCRVVHMMLEDKAQ